MEGYPEHHCSQGWSPCLAHRRLDHVLRGGRVHRTSRRRIWSFHEGRCHCRGTNVGKGTRKGRIRETSSRRRAHRILSFAAWTHGVTSEPTLGPDPPPWDQRLITRCGEHSETPAVSLRVHVLRRTRHRHRKYPGCHARCLPQHGNGLGERIHLPLGTRVLCERHRNRQGQHHAPHLLEQMARLRRPGHPQPLGTRPDRPVRAQRDGDLQAHARRGRRRAADAPVPRARHGLRQRRRQAQAHPALGGHARQVQPGQAAADGHDADADRGARAGELAPVAACDGRLLGEARHPAVRASRARRDAHLPALDRRRRVPLPLAGAPRRGALRCALRQLAPLQRHGVRHRCARLEPVHIIRQLRSLQAALPGDRAVFPASLRRRDEARICDDPGHYGELEGRIERTLGVCCNNIAHVSRQSTTAVAQDIYTGYVCFWEVYGTHIGHKLPGCRGCEALDDVHQPLLGIWGTGDNIRFVTDDMRGNELHEGSLNHRIQIITYHRDPDDKNRPVPVLLLHLLEQRDAALRKLGVRREFARVAAHARPLAAAGDLEAEARPRRRARREAARRAALEDHEEAVRVPARDVAAPGRDAEAVQRAGEEVVVEVAHEVAELVAELRREQRRRGAPRRGALQDHLEVRGAQRVALALDRAAHALVYGPVCLLAGRALRAA